MAEFRDPGQDTAIVRITPNFIKI